MYYAAKFYVYRLIVSATDYKIRFADIKFSVFPLGLEIDDMRNFPIKNENMVSFSAVNITLPFTSLFSKQKSINVEIEKPLFVLNDNLLKMKFSDGALASTFVVNRVDIRRGELIFQGKDIQLQMLNFNLQSGKITGSLAFKLDSPHLKITFPVSGKPVTLEGNLKGEIRQQGTSWKINQILWQTRAVIFNLNGQILKNGAFSFNSMFQGNLENILAPLLAEFTVNGLMYGNAKIIKNAQGKIQVKADFTSPSCLIKENSCANLSSRLNWNSQSQNLDLEAEFDSTLFRSALHITSKDGEISIAARDIPAAYLTKILDIEKDAPLAGTIRNGEIKITSAAISGKITLDSHPAQPISKPFVVKGTIEFFRDKTIRQTTFSGRDLQFCGGQLTISGKTNSRLKTVDIQINAALKNLENISAYSAYYLGIDLLPWKLSGGSGVFNLVLNKQPGRKEIKSNFSLNRFLANQQFIESLQGDVSATPLVSRGAFTLAAADLRSRAELNIANHQTTIHFRDVAGEAKKIIKILDLEVAVQGKINGEFTYSSGPAPGQPELVGSFSARRLNFMGYPLEQLKSGLRSNLRNIELNGLDFQCQGGHAQAEISIDYQRKQFDLNGRIEHVDLRQLNSEFSGQAAAEMRGKGEFLKDPLEIKYHLANVNFYPDREFAVSGQAQLLTDFANFSLKASGEVLHPAGNSPYSLEISQKDSRYSGSFNLNLTDLNLLIPWKNNAGNMRLLGQIYSDSSGKLHSRGVAVFSGQTLILPNFSHSLNNFQGTVTYDNQNFTMQSLTGEMGGGKVEGNGRLVIDRNRLQSLTLNFQGKNMQLYPMDRVSCQANADLTLKYLAKKLQLSGTLGFLSVNWQREIDEPIIFNTHSELSTAESKIREMLQLDVNLNGENFLMNNSLGRIDGKFKLRLSGTAEFPILTGAAESIRGEIFFSDRSFNLIKAKLVFNNNLFIDPLVTIESEAFIQNYRIRFDIKGTTSHAKPELVSSPPLPPQEILALVSLGEVFKRSGSEEVSSQIGGTSLITAKLTEEIKNRANKLLGINLLGINVLRIDTMPLTGQSSISTSWLTIGKSISKDFMVVYSTNFSTSRQEILYLQYQLSPAVSLIAMKNEDGRYSIDLRLRKRR